MTSQADRHREENMLSECLRAVGTWKRLIDTHLDPPDKDIATDQLKELVKDFCLTEAMKTQTSEACEEVADYFNDNDADLSKDVDELYKEKLGRKRGFTGNYEEHEIWKEIFMGAKENDVEEVDQVTQQTEESDYEEMNDSIFYSNPFNPPVDPISKKVIKEPFKSTVCGHVYERQFIVQYIKAMKNKAKCPYIGCGNKNLEMTQLVADKETQDKIENYMRQHSQEDSD